MQQPAARAPQQAQGNSLSRIGMSVLAGRPPQQNQMQPAVAPAVNMQQPMMPQQFGMAGPAVSAQVISRQQPMNFPIKQAPPQMGMAGAARNMALANYGFKNKFGGF